MDYKALIFEKEKGIAVLTLNRPDKLNAMTGRLCWQLEEFREPVMKEV